MTPTSSSIEDAFSNSDLIGMTRVPMRGYASRPQLPRSLVIDSDGVGRRPRLENKMNAVGNVRGM